MLLAISITISDTARADPSLEEKILASALFREGRALIEAQKTAEACSKFDESQRLDPSLGTLLNLANCHELQGRLASAWTQYTEALAWSRRDQRHDRVIFAQERLALIEPKLSWLVLLVPAESHLEGLIITKNGVRVPRAGWGGPTPVDPGRHVIQASAPGRNPWERVVEVGQFEGRLTLTIPVLESVPSSPNQGDASAPQAKAGTLAFQDDTRSAAQAAVPKRDSVHRTWAIVAGSIGVAALGLGAYFGLRAISERNSDDRDTYQNAGSHADVATAAFVVGGLGVGAGVIFW